ncbi:hypothetical protein LJD47_28435, partial [Escherichia coli]|nr:hypothetical protein [Escherichia coli]
DDAATGDRGVSAIAPGAGVRLRADAGRSHFTIARAIRSGSFSGVELTVHSSCAIMIPDV